MKPLVVLSYTYLFDPSETWPHLFEFEKQFADFLSQHGMEAEVKKTVEGSAGTKMMIIRKKQEIVDLTPKRIFPQRKIGDKIRKLGEEKPIKK